MLKEFIHLILITFIPGFELRASIPMGILVYTEMSWPAVVITCVVTNVILGIVTFLVLEQVVRLVTMIGPLEKIYSWYVRRTQKRIDAAVQKYGKWALAVFIGIPLPGTGAISGAVAAHLIGMKLRSFLWANAAGVLMAGAIVTTVCLAGGETFRAARKYFIQEPAPQALEHTEPSEMGR